MVAMQGVIRCLGLGVDVLQNVASTLRRAISGSAAGMVLLLGYAPDVATAQARATWTGFYLGANAGYQWGAGDRSLSLQPDLATWLSDSPDYAQFQSRYGTSPSGFLGGAQLGFNWQAGTVVFGVETDFSWLNAESSTDRSATVTDAVGPFLVRASLRQELDWLGTLRGRIGILPFSDQSVMLYLTGGLAYGRVSTSHEFLDVAANWGFVGSSSGTDVGGTIGGGLEWAAHSGWSLKAEYLYYDLGERTVAGNHFNNPAPPQFGADARYDTQGHIVRVGVNYRLGGH
jgi:outer membrane immunogenic protein